MRKIVMVALSVLIVLGSCSKPKHEPGDTEITAWQYGKTGAISITLDDGSINQFRQALPILNALEFKATFFIITGNIPGSEFTAKFLGRPVGEIIKETTHVPTNKENFFERASAVRFLDIEKPMDYHTRAGQSFEEGKISAAYQIIDEAYGRSRSGKSSIQNKNPSHSGNDVITWKEIKEFASQGHEFGNHTVSHPRLAAMDEKNLLYEVEQGKAELLKQLGPEHTFSAECPFGTENERVMEYALKIHPALRNRMPESFLAELNRGSVITPSLTSKEYVQWQRGPLTKTSVEIMKSWVDTVLVHDNVWLVLTFHGVDGIGWEAKPHQELEEYFRYMKEKEDKLWIATFRDVTKYMRERMNAKIVIKERGERIILTLDHVLDKEMYNLPLTLKTYVPADWKEVTVKQGENKVIVNAISDEQGSYVVYLARPNMEDLVLSR